MAIWRREEGSACEGVFSGCLLRFVVLLRELESLIFDVEKGR